jgi:hypothetical protein
VFPYAIGGGGDREFWMADEFLLPGGANPCEGNAWGNYPMNCGNDNGGGLFQFHGYGGCCGVPYGMGVARDAEGSANGTIHPPAPNGERNYGYLISYRLPPTPGAEYKAVSTEVWRNVVHKLVLHFIFSTGSNGLVQAWLDGKAVYEYSGPFGYMNDPTNNPTFLRVGLYPDRNRTVAEAYDVYEKLTWATTREAAEASAFGA